MLIEEKAKMKLDDKLLKEIIYFYTKLTHTK